MEKTTGETPDFCLIDESGYEIAKPSSKIEKTGSCCHFYFDSIPSVGAFELYVSIKDGDNVIPASDGEQEVMHFINTVKAAKCNHFNVISHLMWSHFNILFFKITNSLLRLLLSLG